MLIYSCMGSVRITGAMLLNLFTTSKGYSSFYALCYYESMMTIYLDDNIRSRAKVWSSRLTNAMAKILTLHCYITNSARICFDKVVTHKMV